MRATIEVRRPGSMTQIRAHRRRPGLGDAQFSDWMASPEFASAWQGVSSQVTAEGGTQDDIILAQQTMVAAMNNLTSSAQGFGLDAKTAVAYAQQYTVAARTVAGAVAHVQGLISVAQNASSPADMAATFNMFTGTMIGVAIAAGAVSAGLGSLIVAGAGVAVNVLQSLGLFGTQNSGTVICQNGSAKFTSSSPPTIQVGCAYTPTGQPKAQGAATWRRFPKGSGGAAGDSDWYQNSSSQWYGDMWFGPPGTRLIDSAFPMYHYIACASVPSDLGTFHQAFSAAWAANNEYALNGLKPQPDWQVLVHLVRLWNRSHSSSSVHDLAPTPRPYITYPTIAQIQAHQAPCPSIPMYEATLVTDVLDNLPSTDPTNNLVNGSLRINTGPAIATKRVLNIAGSLRAYLASQSSQGGGFASLSTPAKVAIGTGVAAAGIFTAGSIWAFVEHQSIGYFWGKMFDKAWEKTKSVFKR